MDANENLNLHSRLLASIRGLKFNSQSLSLGFSLGSVIKNGGVQREVSEKGTLSNRRKSPSTDPTDCVLIAKSNRSMADRHSCSTRRRRISSFIMTPTNLSSHKTQDSRYAAFCQSKDLMPKRLMKMLHSVTLGC